MAGFSLGEIAALAYAGILTDEEAFRLVCKRGELMDKAAKENPGAMVAVMKMTPAQVEEVCAGFDKTYPVNYNSPAQTVVATTSESADAFCEAVKAAAAEPSSSRSAARSTLPLWRTRLRDLPTT